MVCRAPVALGLMAFRFSYRDKEDKEQSSVKHTAAKHRHGHQENWVDSNWASTRKIRMERLPHRGEVGEPTIARSKRLFLFLFFWS